MRHVVFVAPFFLRATLQFVEGAVNLPDVKVYLLSKDPLTKLPSSLKQRLAGHWRMDQIFDTEALTRNVTEIARKVGGIHRLIGTLEQLQIPLAQVRERLNIPGVRPPVARNFREKSLMKDVLRRHQVPCARHCLADSADRARQFADQVGFPLVGKPPDGAGSRGTWR
ncbi:MAG: hypothetical protein QNK37_14860, partial [Acidobacteriota bacterium]|nr:hypothetical protein [Acidobacteriota bacterium]